MLGAPGQDLERGGIREGQHVRLVGRGEALNGGTVETNALFKRDLEVLRADSEALEPAEHVGEPQADEADVALLDGAQDEIDVLLLVHIRTLSHAMMPDCLHVRIVMFRPSFRHSPA